MERGAMERDINDNNDDCDMSDFYYDSGSDDPTLI